MTETAALPETSYSGDELRYVTEHFRELQGLRVAPLWAELLLLAVVAPTFELSRSHTAEMLTIGIVLFAAIWLPWSHAFYRRHYGTIMNPTRSSAPGLGFALIALLVLLVGSALFSSMDRHRGAFNLWFALLFTLRPCFYVGPPNPLFRMRRALYIFGSAVLVAVPASVPFLQPSRWFVIASLSSTFLLLSLYDHWLLQHFLHRDTAISYE